MEGKWSCDDVVWEAQGLTKTHHNLPFGDISSTFIQRSFINLSRGHNNWSEPGKMAWVSPVFQRTFPAILIISNHQTMSFNAGWECDAKVFGAPNPLLPPLTMNIPEPSAMSQGAHLRPIRKPSLEILEICIHFWAQDERWILDDGAFGSFPGASWSLF